MKFYLGLGIEYRKLQLCGLVNGTHKPLMLMLMQTLYICNSFHENAYSFWITCTFRKSLQVNGRISQSATLIKTFIKVIFLQVNARVTQTIYAWNRSVGQISFIQLLVMIWFFFPGNLHCLANNKEDDIY